MVVQHNTAAQNSNRQLGINNGILSKSSEKLSSGYRINRSADDAAGLQISEKLRWQVRGLNRASDNIHDGISLLNTAEGALGETESLIQRMRELSVQAGNDTNTDADREAIQGEIDDLIGEVDRIANTTQFNTMTLLNGSLSSGNPLLSPYQTLLILQPGQSVSGSGITVTNPIIDPSVTKLSSSDAQALEQILKDSIVPQAVNAFLASYGGAFQTALQNGQISQQIGLKIYETNNSVLAYVAMQSSYSPSTGQLGGISLNLSVNVNTINMTNGTLSNNTRRELETTIVHEMMHAFMDDSLTNGMIGATLGKIDAANKFPDWFAEGMAQTAAGGCSNDNDWVNGSGGLNLNANSTIAQIQTSVTAANHNLANSASQVAAQYGTGYLACMYLGYLAAGQPAAITAGSIGNGLGIVLNRLMNGDALETVINSISGGVYTSISDFENKFGDAASAQFIHDLLAAAGNTGNGSVLSNTSAGLATSDLLPDATVTSPPPAYQINTGTVFTPSSVANRNWNSGGAKASGTGGGGGGGGGGGTGGGNPVTPVGPLHIQTGSLARQSVIISFEDMRAAALGLAPGLSVMSYDDAGAAIAACDKAISLVSAERSRIGAVTNRLEHAAANDDNAAENSQAAESRIRDTDMAKEMVLYSMQNILRQAGQSILAQTSKSAEAVLTLLS